MNILMQIASVAAPWQSSLTKPVSEQALLKGCHSGSPIMFLNPLGITKMAYYYWWTVPCSSQWTCRHPGLPESASIQASPHYRVSIVCIAVCLVPTFLLAKAGKLGRIVLERARNVALWSGSPLWGSWLSRKDKLHGRMGTKAQHADSEINLQKRRWKQ